MLVGTVIFHRVGLHSRVLAGDFILGWEGKGLHDELQVSGTHRLTMASEEEGLLWGVEEKTHRKDS